MKDGEVEENERERSTEEVRVKKREREDRMDSKERRKKQMI